ncbi:hypothetical protein MHYP_G00329480 [Metynnis hypsauchen]
MVFQVIIRFEYVTREMAVAPTEAEAMGTTVRELKELFIKAFPKAPDLDNVRMVFLSEQLEDHRTLGSYGIKHLSVITAVRRLRGGGQPPPPDSAHSDTDRDKPPEEPPKRRRSFDLLFSPNMRK